jgi:transposase
MAKIDVKCRSCNKTEEVVKSRYSISKQQRYQCNRYFQLDYINNASKPVVKEQIVEMAINGSGRQGIKSRHQYGYPYFKKIYR